MLLFYIYIFIQLYLQEINSSGTDFDYKDTCKWAKEFPMCGEKFQSPINIKIPNLESLGELPPLKWNGYENAPTTMTLVNSGHSITLTGQWDDNNIPYITDGPLTDAYIFEQLHFHWGPNDSVGSEHKMNGNSFPLEMHMVHFKKEYETFSNAVKYSDGLTVVGLFFDISPMGSEALTAILGGVSAVSSSKDPFELDPFELSSFNVAIAAVQFATYAGSLTTPPCSQSVIWILPINTLNVSSKQMKKFRNIELNHGDTHNYRPTQPLNGRSIHIFTQWSKLYMCDVYRSTTET
ncbi:hypothetical protein PV327_003514 [Microctonus hyperodae]|uniref:Carbonic anhydrase n=1 Tax=Microctonus hyperodae TaxID=165561 RepID=A0AA39L196_MICHY|nr:hypothetical protein PV327_003514 [Microctonus hyperodae]